VLFNSYLFLFAFLPLALAGYEAASRVHGKAVIVWLGLCSLTFYAWWQPSLLVILVGSIAFNFLAAKLIARSIPNPISSRVWLYSAVISNILLLGYYKYFFPTLNGISSLLNLSQHWANVALPLGISFFTITQIAFLIDLYKGSAEQQDLSSYVLFVTFFPHLIAGPILHHREMMPQFQKKRFGLKQADVAVGLTWFILGLGKKVLIADTFAETANSIFRTHANVPAGVAWTGALAYTLQLYFDFSGYSDMALGLARMFSIDFPLNFNSPYKSASMIEVWQRWHMTLGRYIFTYIYNPLQRRVLQRRQQRGQGTTRQDRARPSVFLAVVVLPLSFTMFLAGIWHGAGLQFMIFGLLHGFYLSVNHAWRQYRRKSASPAGAGNRVLRFANRRVAVLFTFLCIVVSLIFFRAGTVGQALTMLGSMIGLHGHPSYADLGFSVSRKQLLQIAAGLAIVWGLPNTQQILTRFKPSLEEKAWNQERVPAFLRWSPTAVWSLAVCMLFFICLVNLRAASTFLYFQF
jgi:alginate O-acetyltransferase complex protein AlgI